MRVRLKRIMINPNMLFHIMETDSAWRVVEGIPPGAKMRGFTLDPYTQILHLFVEHDSFEEIDTDTVSPQLKTSFKKLK